MKVLDFGIQLPRKVLDRSQGNPLPDVKFPYISHDISTVLASCILGCTKHSVNWFLRTAEMNCKDAKLHETDKWKSLARDEA